MKSVYRIFAGALAALMLAGCSKSEFSVEGSVKDGAGRTMALERQNPMAGWLLVDSVKIEGDGSFRFTAPAPEVPEMYRLSLGGKYVYMPVDSLDHLTLSTSAKAFDRDFKLSGTPQAEQLTAFEREAMKVEAYANSDSTAAFRKRVYNQYLRDARGNLLSYHILTRPMNGGWLIDYTDPLYSAVATAFETYRPNDPRTAQLAARAREGVAQRKRNSGTGKRMTATSISMIPISLPGLDGNVASLESLLGKGKPVVVAFVVMTREDTPAINRQLRKLYEAGKADVYEVCLDADQFAWRQAARPLPWTVVFDPDGDRSPAALRYNVGSVPAFFIYNSAGELVQSTGDASAIESLL
ncbi:MAG: AhpC/TSA family protein [Muribaculaceae bacterium]|nr:AhpC/TSA family protein [Muribaculaceae bacterium]